jgi:hypothetical protein
MDGLAAAEDLDDLRDARPAPGGGTEPPVLSEPTPRVVHDASARRTPTRQRGCARGQHKKPGHHGRPSGFGGTSSPAAQARNASQQSAHGHSRCGEKVSTRPSGSSSPGRSDRGAVPMPWRAVMTPPRRPGPSRNPSVGTSEPYFIGELKGRLPAHARARRASSRVHSVCSGCGPRREGTEAPHVAIEDSPTFAATIRGGARLLLGRPSQLERRGYPRS